jgi:hypothetical protein
MERIVEEVLQLISTSAEAEGMAVPPGITQEALSTLSIHTGIPIPAELRQLLLLCNAPNVGPNGIFGISPTKRFLDIESILNLHHDDGWREKGWLPIAGDGCGSYYVIATQATSPSGHPIYFVDEKDYTSAVYVAASGLWQFLRFLLRAEMLDPDDYTTYWPFNKDRVLEEDPALAQVTDIAKPWEVA